MYPVATTRSKTDNNKRCINYKEAKHKHCLSDSWTHFSSVSSRSAFLLAAIFSPYSLSIPLRWISLLWEGLGLRVGHRRSLWALVEGGGRPRWGLQEAADGWMVQHSWVALGGMLEQRGNIGLSIIYYHHILYLKQYDWGHQVHIKQTKCSKITKECSIISETWDTVQVRISCHSRDCISM